MKQKNTTEVDDRQNMMRNFFCCQKEGFFFVVPMYVRKKLTDTCGGVGGNNDGERHDDDDDDDDDDDGELLKGYKVLADGRKTSYFTTTPDEKAAELLKAQAPPRKLDIVVDANTTNTTTEGGDFEEGQPIKKSASGSAWNAAGTTFEERPQTKWVDEHLKKHLAAAQVDGGMQVTNVKKLNGEASILISRGKARYVFDYSAVLEWQYASPDGKKVYKGTLHLPELSSTVTTHKYEQTLKNPPPDHHLREVLIPPFQEAVNAAVARFVADYQARVLR